MNNSNFSGSGGNFNNNARNLLYTVLGTTSAEKKRTKIHDRAIASNIRRENRRKECRSEVLEIEANPNLSLTKKQSLKDGCALAHTTSSLDDGQTSESVVQDLGVSNAFSEDTSKIYLEVEVDLQMGFIPTYLLPPKKRSFRICVEDNLGNKRFLENPLSGLALPPEGFKSKGIEGSKDAKGTGSSDSFGSITSSLFNKSDGKMEGKEVSVTVLDLRTQEVQTLTNSDRDNKLQIEECFQGVEPLSTPVRLNASPSPATYTTTFLLILVQFAIFYIFRTPLVKSFQSFLKQNFLSKILKKDFKDSNEKDSDKK